MQTYKELNITFIHLQVKGHSTGIEELKKNIKFMTVSELNKFTSYKVRFTIFCYFHDFITHLIVLCIVCQYMMV